MSRTAQVFKFGGKALADAEGFRRVANIIEAHAPSSLLFVVSAAGDTTDALEGVVAAHARQDGRAPELLEAIKARHYQLARALLGDDQEVFSILNDLFVEIDWMLEEPPYEDYDFMYDQIVAVGELLSSRLLDALLRARGLPGHWLDARDLIRTDNRYREAWVDWTQTERQITEQVTPLLDQGKLVICPGFIGSTSENFTTTLGRTGSDFSAAVFAHCLPAQSLTIWKDVPGMLTADPHIFRDALKLEELSYEEAVEMTYYGASVIHLKTIKPLQIKGIPLFVKSYDHPEEAGTRIAAGIQVNYPPMVAVERRQTLLRLATRDFSFVAEHHIRDIFAAICDLKLQVNLTQNTGLHFILCMTDFEDRVQQLVEALQPQFEISSASGLELITVRHAQLEVLDRLREGKTVLFEKRIPNTVQLVVAALPQGG